MWLGGYHNVIMSFLINEDGGYHNEIRCFFINEEMKMVVIKMWLCGYHDVIRWLS